ncbi:uracil-DNA glycosylase [uncultured Paludibaculum sp.]|uniref:uracil-DNA glycosylase n=1 Tax=uncultured Paludibaculum sp. TaxID=1765020 RepID=UPI002AAABCC7|nr:uracil-DNA glycosylase [uncultured Paludibaculum sp.]
MDRDLLKQYLEFYRDLGVKSVFVEPRTARASAAPSVVAAPAVVTPKVPAPVPPAPRIEVPAMSGPTEMPKLFASDFPVSPDNDSLVKIQEDMGDCQRCRLCKGRKTIVFGSGNDRARLVFVGEGPGADEDAQGLPFVGRAGQLLTQMIDNTSGKEGFAIRRPDVYICNVVKCRPPENRAPEPDEMEICGQFLSRQLMVLKPRAICALGGTASKALLGTKEGITKLRGKWHMWREIPVMPTYHPSYLLRPTSGQTAKREAWEDLKKVLHYVYDDPPRPLSDF